MEPVRHTASGGIVVAQGTYLLHAYVPMPPPQGDTFGLERWGGGEHQRSPDTTAEPAHRPGGAVADYSSAAAAWTASRRRKNVLIIGDSLVVGIGCRDSMVLPQGICRQLSDRLGVDISWRAVGVNGGDVRTIHQEVLDTVKRFQLDRLFASAVDRAMRHNVSSPVEFIAHELLRTVEQQSQQQAAA